MSSGGSAADEVGLTHFKNHSESTRISGLELNKFETSINRVIRAIRRDHKILAEETNLALRTLQTRVDTITGQNPTFNTSQSSSSMLNGNLNTNNAAQNSTALDQTFSNLNQSNAQNASSQKSRQQPEQKGDNRGFGFWGLNANGQDEENDFEDAINALTESHGVEVYSAEGQKPFAAWARKFTDYIEAIGGKLNEGEKIARLKLMLDGHSRQLFDELPNNEKDTLDKAIKNLTALIDSPQRRELARTTLAAAKQEEGESVTKFAARIGQLVETAFSNLSNTSRRERLCETFMDKLDPEISFLVKLTGAQKDYESARAKALEVESMMAQRKKEAQLWAFTGSSQGGNQPQLKGNFRTVAPNNQQNDSTQNSRHSNEQGSNNGNNNGQNLRSRDMFCTYCRKQGHTIHRCYAKQNQQNQQEENGGNRNKWANQGQKSSNRNWKNNQNGRFGQNPNNIPVSNRGPRNNGGQMNAIDMQQLTDMVRRQLLDDMEKHSNKINSIQTLDKSENEAKLSESETESAKASEPKIIPQKVSSWELPKSIGPKMVSFQTLCLLMMLIATATASSLSDTTPRNPLICQTKIAGTYWKLPAAFNCPKISAPIRADPIPQTLKIYKLNLADLVEDAWICRLVKQSLKEYTNPMDDQIIERFPSENLDLTAEECRLMIDNKKCKVGPMGEDHGLWHTNKNLNPNKRLPIIGWYWKGWAIENCFIFKTKIVLNHFNLAMSSPTGDLKHCQYSQGACILGDKSALIWEPKAKNRCKYASIGKYRGHKIQNAWISDEIELALSIPPNAQIIQECNHTLHLSDQELAVEYLYENGTRKRAKRDYQYSRMPDTVVFESELASRLTYLDASIKNLLSLTLTHTLAAICQVMEEARHFALASIMSNPTTLARLTFQNARLVARQISATSMQIWPCVELSPQQYHWKTMSEDCFEFIPIEIQTSEGPKLAFIDPKSMTVQPASRKSPFCKTALMLNGSLIEIDQKTGKIKQIRANRLRSSAAQPIELDELKPHAFHALVLANFTDIISHSLVLGAAAFSQIEYQIQNFHGESKITSTLSNEWKEARSEIMQELFGFSLESVWQTVITAICLIFVVDLALRMYIQVQRRIHVRSGMVLNIDRQPKKKSKKSVKFEHKIEREEEEGDIEMNVIKGDPEAWPPSVSCPLTKTAANPKDRTERICAIEGLNEMGLQQLNRAVATLNINGVRMNTLFDTGCTTSMICELDRHNFPGPFYPEHFWVTTASGNEIFVSNSMQARMEIAGILIEKPIYFSEFYMPNASIDAVIGSDILKHLPPATFDFQNGTISFGEGHTIEMMLSEETFDTITAISPSATVWLDVNGAALKCLMDTGASLSAAPISIAESLGWTIKPKEGSARSASGHWMRILGEADIELDLNTSAKIQLIAEENFSKSSDYQIIIGCDTMEKLPPITFDFANRAIKLGKNRHPMISSNSMGFPYKIRALEDTTLKPGVQTLVKAVVPEARDGTILLIEELSTKLANFALGVFPGIIEKNGSKTILIPITNPCEHPTIIHKNTTLAIGSEVMYDSVNEMYYEKSVEDYEIRRLKEEIELEIDPSYVINFGLSAETDENLIKLRDLCDKYDDIFSKNQYDLGHCTVGAHHIETTTETPISCKPHRMPFKYKEEMEKHIGKLLKAELFVESDTPWVSNFVPLTKKDGGLRPAIDFRKLNDVTVPDHYPLPRFETILEKISQSAYYSSLDMSSGYFQIGLTEEASRKCGVISEEKVYQATRMPFGLKNATSAFARMMAVVLSGLQDSVLAYVDDIVIFTKSQNFDDHLNDVEAVFKRFRQFNLKLNPKKCVFATNEMQFLGFKINKNGYSPSISKVEVIKNLPNPTTLKQVRRVVGMASFFRKHVPGFSTIVEPLTRLTKKENKFHWGDEQQKAFDKIKEILSSDPVLTFPDYEKPFHIFTDASLVGQGGALMQKDENGAWRVISYCSRTLSTSERKWPAVQVELAAIIFALREFRGFIYRAEVELHCDHKPLTYLMKKADTAPNLGRWLIELQNYNIKIVHVKGKENSLADALSRAAEDVPEKVVKTLSELEDIAEFPVCLALNVESRVVLDPFVNTLTVRDADGVPYAVDLRKELQEDPEANAFLDFLENGALSDMLEQETDNFLEKAKNMKAEGGILYFQIPNHAPKFFIPISLRLLIFETIHASPLGGGHMSVKKTLAKMRKFYWPKMHADIVSWCRQCVTCQLRNAPNPAYRAEMMSAPANTVFATVGVDITGPFPISQKGNKYILNAICCFSKYVISVPIPDTKSITSAQAILNNVYLKFGGCTHLLTDNGTNFTSEFFRTFCKLLYVNKTYSTPHYSRGNGTTERTFRTFHSILAKYLDPRDHDFEDMLNCANFAYNTSVHDTTQESPFFLLFGRDPVLNVEHILDPKMNIPLTYPDMEFKGKLVICLRKAWQIAAEAVKESHAKVKKQYDKSVRTLEIEAGDKILLKNYCVIPGSARKWQTPWRGVFRVINRDGQHLTIVSCASPQSNPFRVHINQVKRFYEPLGPACTSIDLSKEEKEALLKAKAIELKDVAGHDHKMPTEAQNEEVREGTSEEEDLDTSVPTPAPRYSLRPRRARLNSILFLFLLLAICEPISAMEDDGHAPSTVFNLILCSIFSILISLLICIYIQSRAQRQPIFPAFKCKYCDLTNHNSTNCIFRKLALKRKLIEFGLEEELPEQIQLGIQNSTGRVIDQLGKDKNGRKFCSMRLAIPIEVADRFFHLNEEYGRYFVQDLFSKKWRKAALVLETSDGDRVFLVEPTYSRVTKIFSPSYYMLFTDRQRQIGQGNKRKAPAAEEREVQSNKTGEDPQKGPHTDLPKYVIIMGDASKIWVVAAKLSTAQRFDNYPQFLRIETEGEPPVVGSRILINDWVEDLDEVNIGIVHTTGLVRKIPRVLQPSPKTANELGMIIKIDEEWDSVLVITESTKMGNWIRIEESELPITFKKWDLVMCKTVRLSQGTQITPNYILPHSFQSWEEKLERADDVTDWVIGAWACENKYKLPPKIEDIEFFEFCVGLAIKAHAEVLTNLAEKLAMVTSLEFMPNHLARFWYDPPDLRTLVQFKSLWERDSSISIKEEKNGKGLAVGLVREINHADNSLNTEVVLSVFEHQNTQLFDDTDYRLEVPPMTKRLLDRAAKWMSNKISGSLNEGKPNGKILKILLGVEKQPWKNNAREWCKELNEEQNRVLVLCRVGDSIVIVLKAPPGTGKTHTLAIVAAEELKKGGKIAVMTKSNISLLKVCEDLSPKVEEKYRQMLIQSGMAKVEYGELAAKFEKHLLVTSEQEIVKDLNKQKEKVRKNYRENMAKRPKLADEKKMAKIVKAEFESHVYYSTVAMGEQLPEIFEDVTMLVVDEAGQVELNALIPVVMNMPKLSKLLLAGDSEQLGIFDPTLPPGLVRFGFGSALVYAEELRGTNKIHLRKSYRGHPFLTHCLATAIYGKRIEAAVGPEERALFTRHVPLPSKNIPALIMDIRGRESRDPHSFSRTNSDQTDATLAVLAAIEKLVPKGTSMIAICLYQHQADEIRARSKWTVYTVDGFQSQEADIVTIITTRTVESANETRQALAFVNNKERAVVALSRARHGLLEMLKSTPAVRGDYLLQLEAFAQPQSAEMAQLRIAEGERAPIIPSIQEEQQNRLGLEQPNVQPRDEQWRQNVPLPPQVPTQFPNLPIPPQLPHQMPQQLPAQNFPQPINNQQFLVSQQEWPTVQEASTSWRPQPQIIVAPQFARPGMLVQPNGNHMPFNGGNGLNVPPTPMAPQFNQMAMPALPNQPMPINVPMMMGQANFGGQQQANEQMGQPVVQSNAGNVERQFFK